MTNNDKEGGGLASSTPASPTPATAELDQLRRAVQEAGKRAATRRGEVILHARDWLAIQDALATPATAPADIGDVPHGDDPQAYIAFVDAMHAHLFWPSGASRDDAKPYQIARYLGMAVKILARRLAPATGGTSADGVSDEDVARIIDPNAWHNTLPTDGCGVYWSGRRAKALGKAAAIRALQPTPVLSDASEVERQENPK